MSIKFTKRASYWIIGLYHVLGGLLGLYYFISPNEFLPTSIILLLFSLIIMAAGTLILLSVRHAVLINKIVLSFQVPAIFAYGFIYAMSSLFIMPVGSGLLNFMSIPGTHAIIQFVPADDFDSFVFIGVNAIPTILLIYLLIDHKKFQKILERRERRHKIGEVPSDEEIGRRIENLYEDN